MCFVLIYFSTFFFPLFFLFGDPLQTRVVMTFLLTHLHSPHFVLVFFRFFLFLRIRKRNKPKNGFKLPNFMPTVGDMWAPPLWCCSPHRVRDYPLRLRQSEGAIDFHLVSARVCRMLPPRLSCVFYTIEINHRPSVHPSVAQSVGSSVYFNLPSLSSFPCCCCCCCSICRCDQLVVVDNRNELGINWVFSLPLFYFHSEFLFI